MLRARSFLVLATLATAVFACGDDDPAPAAPAGASGAGGTANADLCAGVAAPCVAFPTGTTEAVISTGLVSAEAGTTFVFGAGSFAFTNTLSIATAGVTVRGQGMDKLSLIHI